MAGQQTSTLNARQKTFNRKDLLTECINLGKELELKCTSEGNHTKAKIINAFWSENGKDIAELLEGKKKVEKIKIEIIEKEIT